MGARTREMLRAIRGAGARLGAAHVIADGGEADDTAWYEDVDYVIRVDARGRGRDAAAARGATPVLWFPPEALATDRELLRERQQAVAELVMGVGDRAKGGSNEL